jgi:hypothetical protein
MTDMGKSGEGGIRSYPQRIAIALLRYGNHVEITKKPAGSRKPSFGGIILMMGPDGQYCPQLAPTFSNAKFSSIASFYRCGLLRQ